MRLIFFQPKDFSCNILYYLAKILKFSDMVQYNNCLFVWDQQNSVLPSVFDDYFQNRNRCGYYLRTVANNNLTKPIKQTTFYGINSITYQSISAWNNLPNELKRNLSITCSKYLFKRALFEHFCSTYSDN